MQEWFSPNYSFEYFDWKISFPSPKELSSHDILYTLNIANMYPSRQKSKNMYSTMPDNSSYSDSSQPQQMENLADIHTSAPSNSYMSAFQQMNFIDAQPDPRSFLTPGHYYTGRRGSVDTDTIGSQYAWSTASNTDILSNSPHIPSFETSIGPNTTPFIQGCYSPEFAQLAISDPGMGYTTQQIDKWCIESEPTGDIYQPQPFPTMGSIRFPPSMEMQPEPYPFNNQIHTANEQWLSYQLHSSDPIPETFISAPRSVPAPPNNLYQSTATTISVSSSPAHSLYDPDSPPTASGSASGSGSNSNTGDLSNYGIKTGDGAWRCAYKGCSSKSLFYRGCDLRKHFNRHRKHLFCRYDGCPQSAKNGFSSKKDRARHEAKHNPGVFCEWDGCGKVFSRVDNMKDHVKRIHRKGEAGRA
ncbi:Zinc finger C2H2 [Penicillium cf. griseofulvum]|nr:Zinc finger C2H2 [Penicillium cf. griseofulvum]